MAVRNHGQPVSTTKPLPRELAPGLFWMGECGEIAFQGSKLHSGNSVYLVAGTNASAIVEGASTHQIGVALDQVAALQKEHELPPVRYVFTTHSEVPHAGGVGHMLARFPEAKAYGGITDLRLVWPDFAERILVSEVGDEFDLGGTQLRVVEAVFRDLPFTRWFFDTKRHALFTGDGFAFTHVHDADHCGKLTEETEGLDIAAMMSLFMVAAFHWVEYVDIEPFLERMEDLILDDLKVELIAPTHGLVIGNPRATLPAIAAGMRQAGAKTSTGLVQ